MQISQSGLFRAFWHVKFGAQSLDCVLDSAILHHDLLVVWVTLGRGSCFHFPRHHYIDLQHFFLYGWQLENVLLSHQELQISPILSCSPVIMVFTTLFNSMLLFYWLFSYWSELMEGWAEANILQYQLLLFLGLSLNLKVHCFLILL